MNNKTCVLLSLGILLQENKQWNKKTYSQLVQIPARNASKGKCCWIYSIVSPESSKRMGLKVVETSFCCVVMERLPLLLLLLSSPISGRLPGGRHPTPFNWWRVRVVSMSSWLVVPKYIFLFQIPETIETFQYVVDLWCLINSYANFVGGGKWINTFSGQWAIEWLLSLSFSLARSRM